MVIILIIHELQVVLWCPPAAIRKIKPTTLAKFWYSKLIQIDLFSRKIHKTKLTKWGSSKKLDFQPCKFHKM